MGEEWRDIKGYEGLYEVSNLGRIKSYHNYKCGKILATNKFGRYVNITLCKNKKRKMYKTHRLVAITFIDNPENKLEVNHIDGNKFNNCVNNLEWVTHKENIDHAFETNLSSYKHLKHYRVKPIYQICPKLNKIIKVFESSYEANRKLGILQQNICKCLKGKRHTAGGYKWAYVKEEENNE